jgi:hypothetical protein
VNNIDPGDDGRLQLKIEGGRGEIPLRTFVRVVENALNVLADLDSVISRKPKGTVEWYVTDLSMGSLVAEVEPRAMSRQSTAELAPIVASSFVAGLSQLETSTELPPYFTDYSLNRVRRTAKELRRVDLPGVEVSQPGQPHERPVIITPVAEGNVTRLLSPVHIGIGSVTGTIEMINVHSAPTFNIYETRTNRPVRCKFEPAMQPVVAGFLGQRVTVRGIVKRNAQGNPLSVDHIEIEPVDPQLARVRVQDIAGIDPGYTGNLTAVDYLDRLREN